MASQPARAISASTSRSKSVRPGAEVAFLHLLKRVFRRFHETAAEDSRVANIIEALLSLSNLQSRVRLEISTRAASVGEDRVAGDAVHLHASPDRVPWVLLTPTPTALPRRRCGRRRSLSSMDPWHFGQCCSRIGRIVAPQRRESCTALQLPGAIARAVSPGCRASPSPSDAPSVPARRAARLATPFQSTYIHRHALASAKQANALP